MCVVVVVVVGDLCSTVSYSRPLKNGSECKAVASLATFPVHRKQMELLLQKNNFSELSGPEARKNRTVISRKTECYPTAFHHGVTITAIRRGRPV